MITGLRPKTFTQLQLNAGVFLKNFAWSTYADADALEEAILEVLETGTGVIGATRGGGTFQCTPTIRQIEADGMRAPIKASTVNDMWTVKLTGTMLEITPENFKDALICADLTADSGGKKHTIRIRNDIEDSDYISSLCWVGDTSQGFVLIELENALNLTGATFTFTDKGEGTLPFEFQGHQADLSKSKYAPCSIVFFDPPEAAKSQPETQSQPNDQA